VQDNCSLSGNAATYGGGIINFGAMDVEGDVLSYNAATGSGGAIYNAGSGSIVQGANLSYNAASGQGGAIYNAGSLTLNGDFLSGNTAYLGGGIGNRGYLLLDASTLSGNAATGSGGAIFNHGQLTLSSDWLSSNTAEAGGAVCNITGGTMTTSGNTVTANTAVQGGGIWNSGTLAMMGDNVSYNYLRQPTASDPDPSKQPQGAGLYNDGGIVGLDGSTFIGNNFNADGSLGGDLYGV
jgi:hypothetical protein